MKLWRITFDLKDVSKKTFIMPGDDIDQIILKLKETYPKYRAIEYQVVKAA